MTPFENIDRSRRLQLTSGFEKYPPKRNSPLKSPYSWMEGKRKVDAVWPYWRVHDKLYDLKDFVELHPGGQFWLEVTKGTDITEAFETSHLQTPDNILKKYYVCDAKFKRDSPYTFSEDGFYKTLKRRAVPILEKVKSGPSNKMLLLQDFLLVSFAALAALSATFSSEKFAVLAGLVLSLTTSVAHNFFHQRNNWRMFNFDLMFFSSYEWRITHVLSHHVFPNTIYDYEITVMEPLFNFLPSPKNFVKRYSFIITWFIVLPFGLFISSMKKFGLILARKVELRPENSLPFIQLLLVFMINGSFHTSLWLWFVMHTVANISFMSIGLTAGHQHHDVYHEGDAAPANKDWGLLQITATNERGETFMDCWWIAAVAFGNHTLHHFFPTVDQSKLPYLKNVLLRTCRDFNIEFQISSPWKNFVGCFHSLVKVRGSKSLPMALKQFLE